MMTPEYFDSKKNTWVSLASEDYVKTTNISLTGDVTGSGTLDCGIVTKISDTVVKASDTQTFCFEQDGNFKLVFPLSGQVNLANTMATGTQNGFLKLNIARKSQDGNSYQGFQVRHDFSATDDVFSLQYDKLSALSPVFEYKASTDVFTFKKRVSLNQNKITNLAPGVYPSDAATVEQLKDIKINFLDIDGYPDEIDQEKRNVFLRGDKTWGKVDINTNTSGQLDPYRLRGFPDETSYFLNGGGIWDRIDLEETSGALNINRLKGFSSDGSAFLRSNGVWSQVGINTDTAGQLNINRLNGYPSSSSYFLRGDGAWSRVNLTEAEGWLNIDSLRGYPSDSALFLRGDGTWANPASSIPIQIARGDQQTFAFSNNGDFNLVFPVNGQINLVNTDTVKPGVPGESDGFLKLNIARKSQDGNSYQGFQVRHDFTATNDVFSLCFDKLSTLYPVFGFSTEDDFFIFHKTVVVNKIARLGAPTADSDASNKGYVDTKTWTSTQITDFASSVRANRLDQMAVPMASLNFNAQKLTNLASGTSANDAATVGQLSAIQPNLSLATGTLSPSKITGYPSNSSTFLRGDGVWTAPTVSTININTNTTGQLNINRLNGFPTNSSTFLRGDGVWSQVGINTDTAGQLNINRLNGYPSNSNTFLRGDGAWATPPSSSSYINTLPINGDLNLSGYSLTTTGHIFVDVIRPTFSGTSRVWIGGNGVVAVDDSLRKFQVFYYGAGSTEFYVRPNVSWLDMRLANVYGSKTSTILETNAGGETCSIVMNGDFMQFINPLDTLGFIFTDEDNSSMSSYVAYINGAGQYISACSKEGKLSIVKKEHKDYLERLNKLNIYSYARKHEILPSDPEQRRARKTRKMNTLQVGVLAEEVLEIFDNATNVFKPLDATVPAPSHTPPLGVDYNTLLCYAILAIQELTTEVKQLKAGAKPL